MPAGFIYAELDDRDRERRMNYDVLNTSVRRFLKTVGVTSQREIEKAVRAAVASGKLKGNEALPAKMPRPVGGIDLTPTIDDNSWNSGPRMRFLRSSILVLLALLAASPITLAQDRPQ